MSGTRSEICRLAAYVGHEPQPLSALLYDPPHSLERAAYEPLELLAGTVNVDGTGVAWWPDAGKEPLRYVTVQPPWADPNLPGLAPALMGHTLLAAVRSATPGLPFGPDNVSPFTSGALAGVHNGSIGGFNRGVGRELLAGLSDERFGQLRAMNDSLTLFLLVAQHLDDRQGDSVADAVTAVIQNTAKVVIAAGRSAALNLVVASSGQVVAARTSAGTDVNSLYSLRAGHGSWLASEPLDPEADWQPVAEHSITIMTPDGIETRSIDHDGMTR